MSKQTMTSKQFSNIDYTDTAAYRTIDELRKAGVTAEHELHNYREFGQLNRLRRVDSILKKDIEKVIRTLTRQVVKQKEKGKTTFKEYLIIGGEFRGLSWNDEPQGMSFEEGWYHKPRIVKVYKGGKKFNPETGEDLGTYEPSGSTIEYTIEVPKDAAKRKKLIDDIIQDSDREDIHFYYKDTISGQRDPTFSLEQFRDSTIEELRDLSKKGAGTFGPGVYRDKDNKLRDKEGNLVE